MKSLKKLLISSIVLLIVGFLGLSVTLIMGSFGLGLNNFGTGQGYEFGQEDFCNMGRSSLPLSESKDLSFESVRGLTEDYLKNYDGNFKITEIMEFTKNYYIEIIEEDTGIGAMELLVDKSTSSIFPEYGPNMMWNLKYGMHSRMNSYNKSIGIPIDAEKAIELAKSYLNKAGLNEYVGDEAEKFYGYYTIHTTDKEGNISGMLSVNGFSGDVWYHSWHGIFIKMEEYN